MRTLRILVIDDHLDLAESIGELLELDGHRVALEATGQGGIDAAVAGDFDLVILDVGLPDRSGVDCMEVIASEKPGTEIALITGHNVAQLPDSIHDTPNVTVFGKPVDLEGLNRLVASI